LISLTNPTVQFLISILGFILGVWLAVVMVMRSAGV